MAAVPAAGSPVVVMMAVAAVVTTVVPVVMARESVIAEAPAVIPAAVIPAPWPVPIRAVPSPGPRRERAGVAVGRQVLGPGRSGREESAEGQGTDHHQVLQVPHHGPHSCPRSVLESGRRPALSRGLSPSREPTDTGGAILSIPTSGEVAGRRRAPG